MQTDKTDNSKKIIAIVGATGRLGSLISNELLNKPDVQLRLLVRPGSRSKVVELERRGAIIVEGAIGPDSNDALNSLCKDASTLISALQGGPDIIIEGQKRLLQAAREAGVKRFIPSDYSLDLFKVKPGHIPTSDWRRQFGEIADKERGNVEVVSVLNGAFPEVVFSFLRVVDVKTQTAFVWGEGTQPMELTTYSDTARYTAEVAIDERPVPRIFSIAGDVLDFQGIVRAYEVASGKKVRIERLGSLDDLDARIDQLQKAEPTNLYAYLPLMYYRSMLNGEGKLDTLMNERYPAVRPVTLQEYVARERL